MKNVFNRFAMLAVLTISFLQPSQVAAGTITVFDLTDTLTFSVSSDIASRVTGGLAGGAFCLGETCSFIIAPPAGNPGASFSPRTNIFGPDGLLSDTFQFLNANPTFQSDSETGPPLVPFPTPFNTVTEDGTVQQVGVMSFNINGVVIETNTMFMQSDASPEAPEPASFGLLAAGCLLLGTLRTLRRFTR